MEKQVEVKWDTGYVAGKEEKTKRDGTPYAILHMIEPSGNKILLSAWGMATGIKTNRWVRYRSFLSGSGERKYLHIGPFQYLSFMEVRNQRLPTIHRQGLSEETTYQLCVAGTGAADTAPTMRCAFCGESIARNAKPVTVYACPKCVA